MYKQPQGKMALPKTFFLTCNSILELMVRNVTHSKFAWEYIDETVAWKWAYDVHNVLKSQKVHCTKSFIGLEIALKNAQIALVLHCIYVLFHGWYNCRLNGHFPQENNWYDDISHLCCNKFCFLACSCWSYFIWKRRWDSWKYNKELHTCNKYFRWFWLLSRGKRFLWDICNSTTQSSSGWIWTLLLSCIWEVAFYLWKCSC